MSGRRLMPWVLTTMILGVACGPPPSPVVGERAWVGEYLEVWTTAEATVCGGSFQYLDDHAGLVKAYASSMEVDARRDRYRYYWVDGETWAGESPCPARAAGCIYPDRDAYALDMLLTHEIAHVTLPGQTQSFFEEGLAEVLGDAHGGVLLRNEPEILSIE